MSKIVAGSFAKNLKLGEYPTRKSRESNSCHFIKTARHAKLNSYLPDSSFKHRFIVLLHQEVNNFN